jgi:hypothetical protein
VVNETKFLGIISDSKLTFKPHIANLEKKCLKAMNLLRVVAHTDWGADSTTLLRLYRSMMRSKLDYGCFVYGSARASYLESLDRVQISVYVWELSELHQFLAFTWKPTNFLNG